MAIKEQYLNKWRRNNKDARKKILVSDIVLTEYEHSMMSPQMEEDIEYLKNKFAAAAKKSANAKWDIVKNLQYRIIVRPYMNGKYALVSGRLQLEVLRQLAIQSTTVYVADCNSKQEFMDSLKKSMVLNVILPVKALIKPSTEVSESEIASAMAYLMKNKNFEHEMVADPFTYKITKNPVNLYVAERIGLLELQVKLEAK